MVRLVIFDLDLTLWNGTELYPDVVKILKKLRDNKVSVAMASHNVDALKIAHWLKIHHYFDIVVAGHFRNPSIDLRDRFAIYEKTTHLTKIINWYADSGTYFTPDEILFVDDNSFVLHSVVEQKIKTCHVPDGVTLAWLSKFVPILKKPEDESWLWSLLATLNFDHRFAN